MAPTNPLLSFLTLALLALGPASALPSKAGPPSLHHPGQSPGTPVSKRTAAEVIAALNLVPNPEKGYFVETFRDAANITTNSQQQRSASTAIYYLLEGAAGDSIWHRVDAAEVWHYYAGAPLVLSLSRDDGVPPTRHALGPDVFDGQRPQVVIPGSVWQSARSLGAWTLVGNTVAPGFIESGVELADPGWTPKGA
ncbi:hypothetical protein MAPG_11847 [Magnaporthiopsis poae ATCC 64411]|uniref:DUF985 domain-containing protein n=1 Tax=Magnaporthiopsis poae (strain ATCC 64411 / 73-15) TaxID=644358 RepID=A0A0C4EGB6_MAGP6|nr:hypothetical protein MAPG_11847 [Magnaporthiopsis poae ATCC 64411]